MGLIYCYKVRGEVKYVGQTIQKSVKTRHACHVSASLNPQNKEYNFPLSRAFRKYGQENVILEIIEDHIPEDEIDEREIYWINYYNTHQFGYNQNPGGKKFMGKRLPKAIVDEIIMLLKANCPHKELQERFGISECTIMSINAGRAYYREEEVYPLTQYFKNGVPFSKISEIKEAIKNSDETLTQIANRYEVPRVWVTAINSGESAYDAIENYPLRPFVFYRPNVYSDGRPNIVRIAPELLETFYQEVAKGVKTKKLYEQYGQQYSYSTFEHLCSKVRKWLKERK